MLRPTESPTLFLQQLGRGLRKTRDKAFCTVLDFVGTHRTRVPLRPALPRPARRFAPRRRTRRAATSSRSCPPGCHMHLDAMASEIVLRSLRDAIPTRWPAKVEELRSLRRDHPDIGLAEFLDESGLDLDDVYDGSKSWSDLRQDAGAPILARRSPRADAAPSCRSPAPRRRRRTHSPPTGDCSPTPIHRLRRRCPCASGACSTCSSPPSPTRSITSETTLHEAVDLLWAHPQVRSELIELFGVLDDRIDHVHAPLRTHPDAPLQIHARYTRIEILAALGLHDGGKIPAWQSGVYEAKAANAELFAFTLDKSSGSFSPTTRYRDYAISRTLIHWESQSITRADSATGLRYRNHERDGRAILLFTRLRADDRAFWFLGPATYRGHVGERPMAITWELHHPLSGDLYQSFAAAVA